MLKFTLPKTLLTLGLFALLGSANLALADTSLSASTTGKVAFHRPALFGLFANKPFVNGHVTAISGTTLTLSDGNRTIIVDASHATVTNKGTAAQFADIKVGDMVFAETSSLSVNFVTSTVSVTATSVSIGRAPMHQDGDKHDKRPLPSGTVTAISGTTLTVTVGKENKKATFTVDASHATVTKNGTTTPLSSIQVGDKIAVQGAVSGTTVAATSIKIVSRLDTDKDDNKGEDHDKDKEHDRSDRPVKQGSLNFFLNFFLRGEKEGDR